VRQAGCNRRARHGRGAALASWACAALRSAVQPTTGACISPSAQAAGNLGPACSPHPLPLCPALLRAACGAGESTPTWKVPGLACHPLPLCPALTVCCAWCRRVHPHLEDPCVRAGPSRDAQHQAGALVRSALGSHEHAHACVRARVCVCACVRVCVRVCVCVCAALVAVPYNAAIRVLMLLPASSLCPVQTELLVAPEAEQQATTHLMCPWPQHKNHVLFSGTKILQHTAGTNGRIRCVPAYPQTCLAHFRLQRARAFRSSRPQLVRTIMPTRPPLPMPAPRAPRTALPQGARGRVPGLRAAHRV